MLFGSVFGTKEQSKAESYMAGAVYAGRKPLFDRSVLVVSVLLLLLSIVMIYTASIGVLSGKADSDTFVYVRKQIVYIFLGGCLSALVLTIPMQVWGKITKHYLIWLALAVVAFTCVFGTEIKGARRWISLGFFNFQSSEFLKLIWIIYISGYLFRHIKQMGTIFGVLKPLFFLILMAGMLYAQHDFGSVVVIFFVTFGLFFISGLNVRLTGILGTLILLCGCLFIFTSEYRMGRIQTFLNPWLDKYGDSYQILASFMAIGRGNLTGQGLGESLFKLAYLPEPHTDFILSIWAEETGFVGLLVVLLLEFYLVFRMAFLAFRHLRTGRIMTGEIALGISLWFLAQNFINIGSISGVIPAKGLTLPLLSYGGSSLVMMMSAIAVYLRISYEERLGLYQEYRAEIKSAQRRERRRSLRNATSSVKDNSALDTADSPEQNVTVVEDDKKQDREQSKEQELKQVQQQKPKQELQQELNVDTEQESRATTPSSDEGAVELKEQE